MADPLPLATLETCATAAQDMQVFLNQVNAADVMVDKVETSAISAVAKAGYEQKAVKDAAAAITAAAQAASQAAVQADLDLRVKTAKYPNVDAQSCVFDVVDTYAVSPDLVSTANPRGLSDIPTRTTVVGMTLAQAKERAAKISEFQIEE